MDVARLNMSHGDHADHEANLGYVRAAAERTGKAIAVLADLQGPKIRLGRFADGPVDLAVGDRFTITTDDVPGDAERASTTYSGLPGDVSPGDEILIDDGRVRLRALEVTGHDVVTICETAGRLSNNKGINLPGVAVSVPAMSARDADDVRRVMHELDIHRPVIAKIEKPQAVDNLDEIMDSFDGFMVARGDLGVELPLEDVPIVQKLIVEKARRNAKPVIVATQMLESMISAPPEIASHTVSPAFRSSRDWSTYERSTVSPYSIEPPSGCSCPVSILNRVDLPAPLGPITPTIPPGGREKSSFSINSLSPMALDRPSTSSTLLPRRGPLGITIWARVRRSRSELSAISL